MDKRAGIVFLVDRGDDGYVADVSATAAAAGEEEEVSGLELRDVNLLALGVLHAGGAVKVDSEVTEDVAGEAGAVEGFRAVCAPDVAGSEEFGGVVGKTSGLFGAGVRDRGGFYRLDRSEGRVRAGGGEAAVFEGVTGERLVLKINGVDGGGFEGLS